MIDVLDGRLQRVDFAEFLADAAGPRQVLAQHGERPVDVLHAVPLAFVPSRHGAGADERVPAVAMPSGVRVVYRARQPVFGVVVAVVLPVGELEVEVVRRSGGVPGVVSGAGPGGVVPQWVGGGEGGERRSSLPVRHLRVVCVSVCLCVRRWGRSPLKAHLRQRSLLGSSRAIDQCLVRITRRPTPPPRRHPTPTQAQHRVSARVRANEA